MFPLLGSLISGGASLLGGLFNSSSQQAINSQNIANQDYQNTHSIQERVADARAAGINPLAALGAPGLSSAAAVGDNSMGTGISNAGQDIGRAVAAQSSAQDRMFQEQKRALDIENASLQNQLLASRIRTMNQPGNPPPMPVQDSSLLHPSQGAAALVKAEPQKVMPSDPYDLSVAPGVEPEVELMYGPNGTLVPMPSKAFQGASFGSDFAAHGWDARHVVLPSLSSQFDPKLPPPGDGYAWAYNPYTQSYRRVPIAFNLRYPPLMGSTSAY